MLYYLKIDDIEKIFSVTNVKEIFAKHDDNKGKIKILFKLKDNTNKEIVLDKNNSNLKNNNDFYQYIFDRTFMIEAPLWNFVNKSFETKKGKKLSKKTKTETVWFADRIVNDKLKKESNKYEFLVAINQHVLDFSDTFSKDFAQEGTTYYDKYWDAGLANLLNGDTVDTVSENNTTYDKFTYKKDYDTKQPTKMRYIVNKEKDDSKIEYDHEKETKDYDYNDSWNSDNYTDLIWFTPLFSSSSNVIATNSSNNNLFFEEIKNIEANDKSINTGVAKYSGADFVLAKVKIIKT